MKKKPLLWAIVPVCLGIGNSGAQQPADAPPAWWTGALSGGGAASPKSPVNLGQLKHMADFFHAELTTSLLPDGACFSVDDIFPPKPISPDPEWYEEQKKVANLGQLKYVASFFYDRLNQVAPWWVAEQMELNDPTNLSQSTWSYPYPWNPNTPVAENKQVASLGQLKLVFSLRVNQDRDGDGIKDLQEHILYGGDGIDIYAAGNDGSNTDYDGDGLSDRDELLTHSTSPYFPETDTDGDGLTDIEEGLIGTDATKSDTDGDGLPDGWEHRYAAVSGGTLFDPLVAASAGTLAADTDGDGLSNADEAVYGGNPDDQYTSGDTSGPDDQEMVDTGQPLNDPGVSVDVGQFILAFGDDSAQNTEEWSIKIHQTSGEPAQADQVFTSVAGQRTRVPILLQEGSEYELSLTSLATSPTDLDWSAVITEKDSGTNYLPAAPVETVDPNAKFDLISSNGLRWEIHNPDGLLGTHAGSANDGVPNSDNYPSGKVVTIKSVIASLAVMDRVGDEDGERRTDGETLYMRPDENGFYRIKLESEVTPASGDYEVVISGLPPGWFKLTGLSGGTGTTQYSGKEVFTIGGSQEFTFSLPTSPGGEAPLMLEAKIYHKDSDYSEPLSTVKLKPDCESCSSCSAGAVEGGMDAYNGANLSMDAGSTGSGRGGASVEVYSDDLSSFVSPETITVNGTTGATVTRNFGNNYVESVATENGTIKVEDIIYPGGGPSVFPGYTLKFYNKLPAGGISNTPVTQLRVSGRNLGSKGLETVRMVEQRFNRNPGTHPNTYVESKITRIRQADGRDVWTYFEGAEVANLTGGAPDSMFLRKTERSRKEVGRLRVLVDTSPDTYRFYRGREDLVTISERRADNGQWEVVSQVKETWAWFPQGLTLVEQEKIGGNTPLITTFEYYFDQGTENISGRLKRMTRHDGSWIEYEYDDASGRVSKIRRPFLNSNFTDGDALCDVTTYSYSGTPPVVHKRREILGQVTEESWLLIADASGRTIRTLKRATERGQTESSATNLVYTTEQFEPVHIQPGNGFSESPGQIAKTVGPDGTGMVCSYATVSGAWTKTCDRGHLNAGAVDAGERVVTTFDATGNPVSTVTSAIDYNGTANNVQELMTVTQSNFDTLGRPLTFTTSFDDGSSAQTRSRVYGCCGLRSSTDIRGITTYYHYDHLKRQETATSMGLTTGTQYNGTTRTQVRIPEADAPVDSHGHYTVRASLPNSAIVQSETVTNPAGETTFTRVASSTNNGVLLQETEYTFTYGNGTLVEQENPDGGIIETRTYRDGRTESVVGSAVDDVSFGYEILASADATLNGAVVRNTQTSYKTDGRQNPVSVTYAGYDLAQRVVGQRVGASSSHHVFSYYNTNGQLARTVDGDGVTTLFKYNDEGERVATGKDLNGNNTLDYSADRVTYSETNYAAGPDGVHVQETTTKIYGTANGQADGEKVAGVSQTSVDGLRSWNTPFEQSARTSTSTTTLYLGGLPGAWNTVSVSPSGLTSTETYVAGFLTSSVTEGADQVERTEKVDFFYDDYNRLYRTIDARTGATEVTFSLADQPLTVTQVRAGTNSLVTAYTYDSMGRTIKVDSPDTTDASGNPLANEVNYTHDKKGNILTKSGDQVYKVEHTYDDLSRMVTLTTFRTTTDSAVTTWTYDDATGELLSKVDDAGEDVSYTYTDFGRLKTRTWARGVTTTYHYDFEGEDTGFGTSAKAGDLARIDYSDSTPDVSYKYVRWGGVDKVSDVNGERQFSYRDSIDLSLSEESLAHGTGSSQEVDLDRQISYFFDSIGRTERVAVENGSSTEHAFSFGFDAQTGRLSSVTHGHVPSGLAEKGFSKIYQPNSNLVGTSFAPTHTVTNTWETHRNALKTKSHQAGGSTLSAVTYGDTTAGTDAVNRIGQRLEASRTYNGSTSTEAWGYDDRGQVVDADHSDNAKDRAYVFDGIGNRTSATDSSGTTTYVPNDLNQYGTINPGTAVSPVYDQDGNLTDDGTKLYEWDAENRLIAVRDKGSNNLIAEYRYDYLSRRIYKETTNGATMFLYHGWNLIAEYEANPINGTTNATIASLERTYTWGADLSGSLQGAGGVGGLLAIEEKAGTNAGHYYPLYDGNGNVTELVKEDGSGGTEIVAHYEYDPFGRLTQNDDTNSSGYHATNPFRFSTKYFDVETGFYYYGYRYYDPVTGRWPSRDPIGERGGINLYGMVGNDTINNGDLLGLATLEERIKAQEKLEKLRDKLKSMLDCVAPHKKAELEELIKIIEEDLALHSQKDVEIEKERRRVRDKIQDHVNDKSKKEGVVEKRDKTIPVTEDEDIIKGGGVGAIVIGGAKKGSASPNPYGRAIGGGIIAGIVVGEWWRNTDTGWVPEEIPRPGGEIIILPIIEVVLSERDKCKMGCQATYEFMATSCYALPKGKRGVCMEEAAEYLADCLMDCNRRYPK